MRGDGGGLDMLNTADALREAATVLERAGLSNPRREAEELYAAVVCGGLSAAWLDRELPIAPAVLERYQAAVERRGSGWPQAYAAGRVNFRGHWLKADRRGLIPRPETEGLVELVIQRARAHRRTGEPGALVADIGTGSGCIAIALALEAPVAGLIATDPSADALNLAIENALALGCKERISFRKGPGLMPLLDDRVDVLVSNPPYVASGEWEALDASVRDYEPRLALDGGPDGLGPTRELLAGARGAMAPGGLLALEVDASRAGATAALARAAGLGDVAIREDLFGRPRYLTALAPGD